MRSKLAGIFTMALLVQRNCLSRWSAIFTLAVTLIACGGGDGVDEQKRESSNASTDVSERKQLLAVQPLGRSSAKGAREMFANSVSLENLDFDGDGKADLLWTNSTTGETVAWLMNSSSVVRTSVLLRDPSYKVIGTGDFNGDGKTDLLWYSATAKKTVIWLMNGLTVVAASTLANDPNLTPIAAPDLNGDGKSDLLWYNSTTGQTIAWLMDGVAVISERLILADRTFQVTALPDLNGDGKTDLIWYNQSTGQTIAWLMNGTELAGGGQLLAHPRFKVIATPDLNGDGKSDLLWANTATGETVAWLMNGSTLISGLTLLTDLSFVVTGTADLNGDGNADVLWYNARTGQTVVWLMNGLSLIGGGSLLVDRNFRVLGSSDLNGDGKSDLQWFSATAGQTVTWLMNGSTLAGNATLLTDRNFRLAQDSLIAIVAPVNQAPVANAGPSRTVTVGSTVSLDGRASSDADGDALSYAWTFTSTPSGSAGVLTGFATATPTFIADRPGIYVASLLVSDGKVSSAVATVTVTVTAASVGAGMTYNVRATRIESNFYSIVGAGVDTIIQTKFCFESASSTNATLVMTGYTGSFDGTIAFANGRSCTVAGAYRPRVLGPGFYSANLSFEEFGFFLDITTDSIIRTSCFAIRYSDNATLNLTFAGGLAYSGGLTIGSVIFADRSTCPLIGIYGLARLN